MHQPVFMSEWFVVFLYEVCVVWARVVGPFGGKFIQHRALPDAMLLPEILAAAVAADNTARKRQ